MLDRLPASLTASAIQQGIVPDMLSPTINMRSTRSAKRTPITTTILRTLGAMNRMMATSAVATSATVVKAMCAPAVMPNTG